MGKRLLLELARGMRKEPTRSEDILWEALRNRRLRGVKFRRQQRIDRFIVDFFAPSHRFVIEVDGSSHDGRKEWDALRQDYLHDCGLNVVRFTATEVETDLSSVLQQISKSL